MKSLGGHLHKICSDSAQSWLFKEIFNFAAGPFGILLLYPESLGSFSRKFFRSGQKFYFILLIVVILRL